MKCQRCGKDLLNYEMPLLWINGFHNACVRLIVEEWLIRHRAMHAFNEEPKDDSFTP